MSVVTTGQITIADLNDAVSATLSNETFVAPSNPDGSGSDLTGAATTMKVFLGGEDDSANWTVAASVSSGVTGSLSGKTYTVSSLTANSGYVDLTASRIGFPSITRRFSLSKARKGNRGSVTTARSISGTAWSNTEAATAISDAIADSPADGDMVTQYNSAQKFSETRVRKNAAWTKVTEFFGGDVMVKGSLTASKITIGDTSNMVPDPDFRDTESWQSDITGFSFDNGTSFEAADRVCLINGFTSTGSANGYAGEIKTTPITVEPETDYAVSVVFRSNSTNTEGVIQLVWVEYNNAGAQVGYNTLGTVEMGSTAPVKISGRIKTAATGARGVFRVRLQRNAAGNFMGTVRFYNPVMRRAVSGELVVDGSIEGKHIGANTIKAKHLEIGSRNLTLTGIAFEHNSPSSNKVSWTAGAIRYVDDAGAVTSKTITASNATWSSGILYIYWAKGATALSTTTNQSTAFDDDNVLLATYEGGIKLDADYGRTIIDGSAIKTSTIDVGKLDTTSFTNAGMSVFGGVLKSDDFAVGETGWRIRATGEAEFESLIVRNKNLADDAITADKVMIGDYTNLVPNGNFSDNALITAHWSGVTGPGIARYLSKAEDTSFTQTGERSLLLQKNTGSETSSVSILSKKFIPVEGGADYYAEIAIRTNLAAATAGCWYRLMWYNHAKTWIAQTDAVGNAPITTSWVKHGKKIVAPAGAAFVRFQLYNTNHQTTTNNLIFDRLIFRRANAAELIVDGSIKGVHIESDTIDTGHLKTDSIKASKLKIGDTSNMVPDPDFNDVAAWEFPITGYSFVNGTAAEATSRMCLIDGLVSTGTVNGFLASLNTKLVTVEPLTDYFLAVVFRGETGVGEGVAQLFYQERDYAGEILSSQNLGTYNLGSSTAVKLSGRVTSHVNAASAQLRIRLQRNAAGNFNGILRFYNPIMRRAVSAELIVNGAIDATKVTTGELITLGAQIKDATIKDAHITNVSAAKLLAGTALVGSLTVSGKALSALKTDAELGASDPVGRINGGTTTINGGKITTGTIRASKLQIGDTSNLFPDPMMVDPDVYSGSVSYAFSTTTESSAGSSTNFLQIASGQVGEVLSAPFPAEGSATYYVSSVMEVTGTGTGQPSLLVRFYSDLAGTTLISEEFVGTRSSTAWGRVSRNNVTAPSTTRSARFVFQQSVAAPSGRTSRWAEPIMRRSTDAKMIVNGTIDATKLVAGEVITGSAQIRDATIVDAHITDLSAAKLTAGTALVGSLTVSGKALSALKSDAELGASDPGTRINAGVTKINPGQITISGGTTLANWRGSDTTKINGGEIQTNTVTLEKLTAGTGRNLLMNTAFSTMLGWSRAGSGGVHSASVLSKREGGGDWAGGNYPVLMLRQAGTATDGYSDITSRHITLPGTEFAGSVPVKPGVHYEASAQISTHRCGGVLLIMFFDRNDTFISQVFSNLGADVQGSSTNPDDWVRYVVRAQAPANAAYAGITARKYGTISGGDSYLFFHKPQIIETVAGATQTAPYSPGGYTFIDGGSIITDSIEADRIKAGVITADKMNTQSFTNEGLSLFGGALQSDNYVPNASGWRIGKNGVAEFEDLTVRSKNIEAEAVTASKLKIGDASNMVLNDWSRGSTDGWTINDQIAFTFAGNTLSHSGWRLESKARDQAWSPFVPCTPSEWYYVSAWVYNNATEDANLVINSKDGTGANAYWGVVGTATKGAWVHLKGWWQAPGGATQIRMLLQVAKTATGGNSTYWTKPVMRRASDRDMVVDGEITAGKLNVNSLETAGLSVFGGSLKSDNFVPGTSGWRIGKTGVAEFEDLIVRSKNIDLNAVSKLREVTLTGVTGATGNGSWVTAGSYAFNPEGDDPVSIWLCALGALTPGSGVYGQLDVRILFRGTERVLYEGAASWLGTNTGRTMINIADRVTSGGSSSGTISIQAKANAGTFALKNIRLLLGEFKR